MKNLLNLNGLYDSSPNQTGETQSRQNRTVVKPWSNRGQVVLTLLFFLTLGVGNVWGDTNINAGKRLYFFNGGEWNADIWLDIWNSSHDYKGLTQLGSTHYWYWQSTQWNNYYNFAFYKAGDRNGSCSSAIGGATIDKDYIFIPSSDWKNTYWIDDYKFVSPSGGVTIYFDNTDFGFSSDKIYFRSGFEQANEALKMSPVAGTANLYSLLLPNSYPFKIYTISESYGHTNLNSIYNVGTSGQDSHIAKQLVYTTPSNNFGSDFTFYYLSDGSYVTGESCQYYNYSTFSGHTRNVAITAPSHGTIQVSYTGENGYPYDFTSGNRNLAQTCNITVTATADRGYTFTSLTRNSVAFTSGSTYAIREDNTFAATFTPKSYTTVNLDNQGGTGSTTIGSTVTTGTAYPSVTKPVKDGYHFMGYYSGTNGTGTKYYNEDGTPAAGAWFVDANTDVATPTLYAYYATPTISATFSPASVLPLETVTVTPSFDHAPEGNSTLCYVLTTGGGREMEVQPEFTKGDGYAVSFEAPATPGTYSVDIRLFNANEHSCADRVTGLVSTYSHATSFTVEASNAVTVQYKCGNVELRPSTTIYATSNQTAATVTAPEIPGLTFHHWDYTVDEIVPTDGFDYQSNPIQIHATRATTLVANYSQSGYVYFKNTRGWDNVYFYRYDDRSYWGNGDSGNYGIGAHGDTDSWTSYCAEGPVAMTKVAGTDDLYCCKPSSTPGSDEAYVFTDKPSTEDFFGKTDEFAPINVLRIYTNFDATNHMIVPDPSESDNNQRYDGRAHYFENYFVAPSLIDWGWTLRGNWGWDTESLYRHFTAPKMGSLEFQTTRYFDEASTENYIQVYDKDDNGRGKASGVIDATTAATPTEITTYVDQSLNIQLKTNFPGEYAFKLTFEHSDNQTGGFAGKVKLAVTYPVVVGDFRLVYTGGTKPHPGNVVKKRANGKDVVDMFVAAGQSGSLKVQSCSAVSASSVTWTALASCSAPTYATGVDFETILSKGGAGVYSFTIEQNEDGTAYEITKVEKYTGRFYVRTNCVNDDKWNYKDSKDDHAMTYSEYSTTLTKKAFSHYFVKDIHANETGYPATVNIRFTVATENSEAITDTIFKGDASGDYQDFFYDEDLNRTANVRFTYNQATNKIWRAYTEGPTNDNYMRLKSDGTVFVVNNDGTQGGVNRDIKFNDRNNWVYELDVYANVGAYVKLTAEMHDKSNTAHTQYLKGIDGNGTDGTQWNADDAELLLGGTGTAQHMRITYDFKTDRMITAWLPSGTIATGTTMDIDADVLLIRKHQLAGQSITIAGTGKLTNINTVYGVMQFEKDSLNDVTKSRYSRNLYWISFPFDVKLSDVFGVGTYGQHWIIEYYDGKERAEKGYWADSPGFWKFVTPDMRDTYVLKANQGYVLALNLDKFGDGENGSTLSSVWGNNVTTTYLYFPSKTEIGNLELVANPPAVPIDQNGYQCTIDRTGLSGAGADINKNRTVADSYWHMIGAPSFADAGRTGLGYPAPTTTITENVLYVYKWNPTTNLYSVQSTSGMTFNAMHSYMVQYSGESIAWTNVTATPSTSVARRRQSAEDIHFAEFRLDLNRGEEGQDHTFVRLSDDEETTANFDFNKDLMKEFNAGKANIYTVVTGYLPTAGNTLPLSTSRTTVVPVGVQIKSAGDYTFAMPEGTNGVGVTLLDNETGVRTSLSALDYTVYLEQGTYDSRFLLEISPVQNTPTDLGNVQGDNEQGTKVRKVLIDGILYIVKDGKLFDARGTLVR